MKLVLLALGMGLAFLVGFGAGCYSVAEPINRWTWR